jgi:hypothetical protein
LTAAKAADPTDSALIAKLQAAVPVDAQIKEIQVERKELAEKAPKDKHFSQGSMLALAGTVFAIEVCKTKWKGEQILTTFSHIHSFQPYRVP